MSSAPGTTPYASFQKVNLTFAPPIPSLSPAGLAAARLSCCSRRAMRCGGGSPSARASARSRAPAKLLRFGWALMPLGRPPAATPGPENAARLRNPLSVVCFALGEFELFSEDRGVVQIRSGVVPRPRATIPRSGSNRAGLGAPAKLHVRCLQGAHHAGRATAIREETAGEQGLRPRRDVQPAGQTSAHDGVDGRR